MRQKRTFEENLALAKARVQQAAALQTVEANRPLDVQLPLWAEVCRGVPNSVLRSALFGVVRRGPRSFQQRVQKASVDGVKIIHTGPQLDQADLDVWEQALQLARTGGLGCRIQFTASQFLKCIGRGNGKSQHEWLKGAFARLAASVVEIKDAHRAYFGAILSHGGRDDHTGRYVIEVNPKLIELYGLWNLASAWHSKNGLLPNGCTGITALMPSPSLSKLTPCIGCVAVKIPASRGSSRT